MIDHGTPLGYRKGCQCAECLLAWSMYIDHYRQARSAGMTFRDYLAEMGCTEINAWIQKQVRSDRFVLNNTTNLNSIPITSNRTKPAPVNI